MNRRQFLARSFATSAVMPFADPLAWGADTKPLIIDSHVHVWVHDPAYPFAAGAKPPAEDTSAEMLLALMKANGVSRTVIIQVIHYKWDNSYVASVLKRYPGTFQAVCRVNPEDPAAPDELSRLTEQGFRGVRLSPANGAAGDWIRGPLMPPLWKRCAELKVPMTLLIEVDRLPQIVPLIEANPDLTVVIDHMADCPVGQPEKLKLLTALNRYPKLFVKVSHMWSLSKQPYPYPDAADQVKHLVDSFGAKRLMWGSDWPISLKGLSYAKSVELYRDHFGFVSPQDHEEILYKTVQRVWPFGIA